MIIILEGPDGGGKSTLAAQLSRQTKYPIARYSYPKTAEEKEQMMQMYVQAIKEAKNVIFDRSWYSELVYGPVMRNGHVLSYPQMYALEEMLAKKGAVLIYCTASPEVLWRRCMARGEDYVTDQETFIGICKAYDELMSVPHHIPVVKYEYKDM